MSPNERTEGGTNNPVALILIDKWAITFDSNQWMLSQARKRRAQTYWHPVSYIGSTKAVLLRVARENGVVMDKNAQAIIETWPERFLEWYEQQIEARAA